MSDFKIQYLRYRNNDISIHSNVYFLSKTSIESDPLVKFFENGEEMLGNLFNIWFLSVEQSLTNDTSQVRAKSCPLGVYKNLIPSYKNRYSCSTCSSLQNVSKKISYIKIISYI